MSINLTSSGTSNNTATIAKKTLSGDYVYASGAWKRNPSWLAFTAPGTSDEKFVGLHAVWESGNFLALSAAGDYTVDWGDGSATENFSSGVVAYHEYDYADTDLDGTNAEVTFQDSGDTVTRTDHGYVDGDTVQFYNVATTTGLTEGAVYYVRDATTNTFKVATNPGGTAVALTNDGTGTLLPYKQVIVQVYPQAGQSLTQLNLHQKHNQADLQRYSSGFLDIAVAGQYITDLRIGVQAPGSSTQDITFAYLQQVNIVRTNCKSMDSLLRSCSVLSSVVNLAMSEDAANTNIPVTFTNATGTVDAVAHGFNDGDPVEFVSVSGPSNIVSAKTTTTLYFVVNATTDTFQVSTSYGGSPITPDADGSGVAAQGNGLNDVFRGCALVAAPTVDFTNVIRCALAFSYSSDLRSVGTLNLPNAVTIRQLFVNDRNLKTVGSITAPKALSLYQLFSGAETLLFVGSIYAPSAEIASYLFYQSGVQSAPYLELPSCLDASYMFGFCASVSECTIELPLATTTEFMFYQCLTLQEVTVRAPSSADADYMFAYCYALRKAYVEITSAMLSTRSMFYQNYLLADVTVTDTSGVTNMDQMFAQCRSLSRGPELDMSANLNCYALFNQCRNMVSTPPYNSSVCTSFSSMFSGCTSLVDVGALDTSSATNMSSMFNQCNKLPAVPYMETSQVTTFYFMFAYCYSLSTIPNFDTSSGTNFGRMFLQCNSLAEIPPLDMSAATSNFSLMTSQCYSLMALKATGINQNLDVSNCKLSSAALDEIYTNLATVSGQTITVTGNYGVSGDDPTIATAKGWTVVG